MLAANSFIALVNIHVVDEEKRIEVGLLPLLYILYSGLLISELYLL